MDKIVIIGGGGLFRPATQEEINSAEDKIMWGQYEVDFGGDGEHRDEIKIGCVTVSKELWDKTAKKAGWL